jgi:hypothetical protein
LTFVFIFLTSIVVTRAKTTFLKSIPQERLATIAKHPTWLKLYRYRPHFFGGYRSQADDPSFFFSDNGARQPLAELKAFLNALENRDPKLCRYFARQKFVKEQLNIDISLSPAECPEYWKFKNQLTVDEVYMVFTSYYLQSPASAFGHTFMRLGNSQSSNQLLDFGVNFSAEVTTDNALLYALFGIIGAFEGRFTTLPYFYKIREYNDFESRDIWSYKLELTSKQIDLLIDHIWEMGSTHFDYFYFSENCSYHILAVLDAITQVDLLPSDYAFVIPIDTVKKLHEVQLLEDTQFRPSSRKVLGRSWSQLSDTEKKHVSQNKEKNFSSLSKMSELSKREKARVIETTIDYLDYIHAEKVLLEKPKWIKRRREFLVERAKLGRIQTFEHKTKREISPIEGHDTDRIRLGLARKIDQNWSFLEYRFALHDMLDPLAGQKKYSGLEMGRISFMSRAGEIQIQELNLFEVNAISPVDQIEFPLSFQVSLGQDRWSDRYCEDCVRQQFKAYGGSSFELFSQSAFYLLSGVQFDYVANDEEAIQLMPGLKMGLITQWRYLSLNLEAKQFYRLATKRQGGREYQLGLRAYPTENLFVGVDYRETEGYDFLLMTGGAYF